MFNHQRALHQANMPPAILPTLLTTVPQEDDYLVKVQMSQQSANAMYERMLTVQSSDLVPARQQLLRHKVHKSLQSKRATALVQIIFNCVTNDDGLMQACGLHLVLSLATLSKALRNLLDKRRVIYHLGSFPDAACAFYLKHCRMHKHEMRLRANYKVASGEDFYTCLRHRLDTEPDKYLDAKNRDQIHCDLHRTNTTKATYTKEG